MKKEQATRILEIYKDIEDLEPDISTERLLAMTADRAMMQKVMRRCDASDVCDALFMREKIKGDV